jgi:hypothetical protein
MRVIPLLVVLVVASRAQLASMLLMIIIHARIVMLVNTVEMLLLYVIYANQGPIPLKVALYARCASQATILAKDPQLATSVILANTLRIKDKKLVSNVMQANMPLQRDLLHVKVVLQEPSL